MKYLRRILFFMILALAGIVGYKIYTDGIEAATENLTPQAVVSTANGLKIKLQYGGDRLPDEASVPVPVVMQNPELPTGCESTSLTMDLNTLGFPVEKTTIVDQYLVRATEDYKVGFSGDPYSSEGAGIWPPGLARTARKYLREQETMLWAHDLSGDSLEKLYPYIAAGYPVLLWVTSDYESPNFTGYDYDYHGKTYQWYGNEHCVVLAGYSKTNNTVTLVDPLQGELTQDASAIANIYSEVGSYAIAIY